ncbi:DALR anticodon-binding domain-containing protein [Nocardia lijiangensis]|uniref:DALR anticodon-binding domain-containing protein n=1 Tax=Nocardia lijiangensis TaxID=299618 RepID=UPI003D75CECA
MVCCYLGGDYRRIRPHSDAEIVRPLICRVITAGEPIRSNRIALCQLTARTLELGLGQLGIAAPQRM